jgi:hypothetical protein
LIDGASDAKQLRVQGHTTQTQPLQTWETSAGSVQGQMTGDGRLALGDDLGVATPDALLEVHRADTSTAKPKRGFHSLGRVAGALSDAVAWVVQELELLGSGVISAVQTALRVRLTHDNSATSSSAELRGADVEVIQKQGTVNILTALRAAVTRQAGTVTTAYGVKVENIEGATNNYALHTGKGLAHLSDALELQVPVPLPGTPPANNVRMYPKTDGKIYIKNSAGVETELGSSGGAGSGLASTPCEGRLTLTTNVAVPVADIASASTLYFTPYNGNQIAFYNGSAWTAIPFSQVSLSLSGMDRHRLYDIFAYNNAGLVTLEAVGWVAPASAAITAITNATPPVVTSAAHGLSNNQLVTIYGVSGATGANGTWRVANVATDTFTLKTLANGDPAAPGVYTSGGSWVRADGNSTRATNLVLQNGVLVKSGDTTRRYLGTIRITETVGQTADDAKRRLVWNFLHRVPRKLRVFDATASWTYDLNGWRPTRDDLTNRVEVVLGKADRPVRLIHQRRVMTSANQTGYVGVGLDVTNTSNGDLAGAGPTTTTGGVTGSAAMEYLQTPGTDGYHFLQLMEHGGAPSLPITFYSSAGGVNTGCGFGEVYA